MTYKLSPRLFLENGPAILASRARAARESATEYQLAKSSAASTGELPASCVL
jgi:hypothetical protein